MTDNELLTPSEVAEMFRVNPKTVTRWARAGRTQNLPGRRKVPFKDEPRPTDTRRDESDCRSQPPGGTMAENELLTPAEVAVMFRVNPKTVTRWARAGRISAVRTLGGHRRFRASEIRKLLEEVGDLA
jgi:excisionase family DNA binding protein